MRGSVRSCQTAFSNKTLIGTVTLLVRRIWSLFGLCALSVYEGEQYIDNELVYHEENSQFHLVCQFQWIFPIKAQGQ